MSQTYDTSKFLEVSDAHIETQFLALLDFIQEYNEESRAKALLTMYATLKKAITFAPASGKITYHLAYIGGYIDHVINVINTALLLERLYKHIGGDVSWTTNELVFAAMHHDLGKIRHYEMEHDPYWIQRGHTFKHKDHGSFQTVFDKSILILNEYNIKFTQNEMLGIRMADGLFSDGAKEYFYAGDFKMKSHIGYVIHWADWMATRAEADKQRLLLETP